MPVTVHVDSKANLITFRCEGKLTLDDIQRALDEMFADPGFRSGLNALWDLRDASIGVYAQEIPDLLRMIRDRQDERGRDYRVAILVAGSPDFGLSTLFEMSAHAMPFTVRVFRGSTEAGRWLKGEQV